MKFRVEPVDFTLLYAFKNSDSDSVIKSLDKINIKLAEGLEKL